jgi:HPt (histidine-containing phosphotransfer) domain-containing protein
MTANAMVHEREKVLSVGMNDYVAKPLHVETMFLTIARWVTPNSRKKAASPTENLALRKSVAPVDGAKTSDATGSPDFPGIDQIAGLARCMNDLNLYHKQLRSFANRAAGFTDAFTLARNQTSATEDQTLSPATRSAHTLRGTAGSIGAKWVEKAAMALEAACSSEHTDPHREAHIQACLKQVEQQLEPVLAGLVALSTPDAAPMAKPIYNPTELIDQLDGLQLLVDASDGIAQDSAEAILKQVQGEAAQGIAKKLLESLSHFDFDGASQLLSQLRALAVQDL